MKVAVVGATGMVGQEMLKVIEERKLPVTQLLPVASAKSVGKTVKFKGEEIPIVSLEDAIEAQCDLALFSAGGGLSLEYAPKFAEKGTVVIDNSSAWRMDDTKKLVVPEVNAHVLEKSDKIIANPNCSTIQLVMALKPLHDKYKIKRVVVSTYQSISGSGKAAVDQLEGEIKGEEVKKVYPYQIFKNVLPHCDVFEDNDYTKEEMKLTRETQKILDRTIAVTATAVRVPVSGGHSEAVNIEFENDFDVNDVRKLMHETEGVVLKDNVETNIYPMPLYAAGKDEVFVGRIRRDFTQSNTLNMWVVADNLRKGAATNAVQIADYMIKNDLLT